MKHAFRVTRRKLKEIANENVFGPWADSDGSGLESHSTLDINTNDVSVVDSTCISSDTVHGGEADNTVKGYSSSSVCTILARCFFCFRYNYGRYPGNP